jgi:hypothetical protein
VQEDFDPTQKRNKGFKGKGGGGGNEPTSTTVDFTQSMGEQTVSSDVQPQNKYEVAPPSRGRGRKEAVMNET